MSVNRSRRALELFEQAMALPEDQVGRFLDEACETEEIRSDVESLLASSHDANSFLPAVRTAVPALARDEAGNQKQSPEASGRCRLQPDTVLMGRYVVKESIGAGGIGEVYRAEDSRLGRDVAIKILNNPVKIRARAPHYYHATPYACLHPSSAKLHK